MYVLYICNYCEIVQSLFLKYLMEVLEPEDPHQFENLSSNNEYHSCADSSAPQVTKEKELTLHDLCTSQKGLEQMPLAWHLRLPHPTWEESVSHFLHSVDPAQHYLQGGTVGSIHTDNTHPF